MTRADLHIHSNNSDGSDSIKELANVVIKSGLDVFALTDHDTVEGCEEMSKLVPSNIKFIPSVELTCKADFVKCHILGYNCDYKNKTLLELIEKGKVLRKNKLETRIKYLKDVWNINMTQEELDWLYSRKSVVKTHLANIIVNRGLAKNNLEAMDKYLEGCKAGDTRFTGIEGVNAIISAGGIPVWAHPLGGEGEVHISEGEFYKRFEVMKSIGIQGLECHYSRYDKREAEFLVKVAKDNGLFITGGSDYHGSNKDIPIGKLNVEGSFVDAKEWDILNKV